MNGFDPQQHPRSPANGSTGGQFATKARSEADLVLPDAAPRCCWCTRRARVRVHLSTGPSHYCPQHVADLMHYDPDTIELLDGPDAHNEPPLAGFHGGRAEESRGGERSRTSTTHGSGNEAFDAAVRALLGVDDPHETVAVTSLVEQHGSTYTPESWSEITVACAGREQTFATLPDLLRRLEFAREPKVTQASFAPVRLGEPIVIDLPHEQVACTLGNLSPWQALLVFPSGTKRPRDIDRWWHSEDTDEEWGWVDLAQVHRVQPGS